MRRVGREVGDDDLSILSQLLLVEDVSTKFEEYDSNTFNSFPVAAREEDQGGRV